VIKACIQKQDVDLLIQSEPSTFHRLHLVFYFSSSFARSPGRFLNLFLNDRYATFKLTREITTTRMALIKVNWNLGGTKRRKDRQTEVGTYKFKMRFLTVVFLNFGLSLVAILKDRKRVGNLLYLYIA
jgi:hypothetical protein